MKFKIAVLLLVVFTIGMTTGCRHHSAFCPKCEIDSPPGECNLLGGDISKHHDEDE